MMQKFNQKDLSYVPVPSGTPAATSRLPRGEKAFQTGKTPDQHQTLQRSLFPVDGATAAEGNMSSANKTRNFVRYESARVLLHLPLTDSVTP